MDKKMTMPERINEVYKYAIACGKAKNKQQFAEKVGITNVTLSRFLTGKKEPSAKTLEQINERFGRVFNKEWLLVGVGDMLSSQSAAVLPEPTEPPIGQEPISSAISMLITEMRESRIAKDEQIDRLLTIIENMQNK